MTVGRRAQIVAALVALYVVGAVVILLSSDERGLLGTLLVGVMSIGAIIMLLLPSSS